MSQLAKYYRSAVSGLRRWAIPVIDDDTVKARTGALITTLLLIAAVLWSSSVILMLLLKTGNRANIILALIGSALLLVVREFVRRGRLALATTLGIATVWAVITAFHYNLGTPFSVHLFGYLMLVIVAAWLSGAGGGIAASLLSVASIYVLARAERAGLLPPPVPMQPLSLALNMVAYLGASFALFNLARSNFQRALGEAHAELARRKEAEAALCDLNATLEQHVAERTRGLLESEERYRDLYENAPLAFFSVGPDARIRRCNRQAAQLLGYTVEQLVGRPIFDLYADTPHGKPKARQVFQRFLAREPLDGEELQMAKADGKLIWISLSVGTVLDATGQVLESRSAAVDISARKQTEEALAESEERYRTLLALSPDGVVVLDNGGRILLCNQQLAEVCGQARAEDMFGHHALEFLAPGMYELLFAGAAAVLEGGRDVVRNLEGAVVGRGGQIVDMEYSIARVPWSSAPQGEAFVCVARDVTRRKADHAELERYRDQLEAMVRERTAELERSAESLAAAERIAHVGSWEWDLQTGERHWSDEACAIFGVDPDDPEATRINMWNAVVEEDCDAVEAAYSHALTTGETFDMIYRIRRPSGEMRTVRGRAEMVQDVAGRTEGVQGIVQDVTEHEHAKAALRQRADEATALQELGRLVSLSLPFDDIITTHLDNLLAHVKIDMAQIFLVRDGRLHLAGARTSLADGVGEVPRLMAGECLCGLALAERQTIYSGDVDRDGRCIFDHCHVRGVHSLAALPLRNGDQIIGVLSVGALERDALDNRLEFLGIVADLVAVRLHNALLHQEMRQHAAGLAETVVERTRELQAERDRTHAILETVGESVVVTDQDGQVLFANPATEHLTGLSRDECLGRPLWQGWTVESVADTVPTLVSALGAGQAWRGEVTGLRRDGRYYSVMLTGTSLYDAGTPALPVGGVWVQRDITEVKEAARLKDLFVSNVSHELRTPVSIISLNCDNLQAFGERLDDRRRSQILYDIHEQAHVLQGLVDNVLLSFQLGGGHLDRPTAALDLAALVREEAERQQAVARQHSQQLAVSAEMPVVVRGNEVHLRQVVRNLVDNAIKYTPAGGRIECTCTVRACDAGGGEGDTGEAAEGWAVVAVADTGRGIDQRHLPHLFDRFYRVDAEGDVPGTGLGLPIVRELVELHGGRVEVASAPGRGSTFTVYLPLIEEGRVEG